MNRTRIALVLLVVGWLVPLALRSQTIQTVERNDLSKYFDAFGVDGSFLLLDETDHRLFEYNPAMNDSMFTPASTFKIANALIGLECHTVANEKVVFTWDGVTRSNPAWNKDQDMETAFRHSTVWYFQALARKTGTLKMQQLITKLKYGNMRIDGGIDQFWLTGGLRISPNQQLDFLKRLFHDELPLRKPVMETVRRIMIMEMAPDYALYTKTGWGQQNGHDIGWYVGCLNTGGRNYYFVTCIRSRETTREDFARARVDITRNLFVELGITR